MSRLWLKKRTAGDMPGFSSMISGEGDFSGGRHVADVRSIEPPDHRLAIDCLRPANRTLFSRTLEQYLKGRKWRAFHVFSHP
jgi:hypothetical protein